MSEQGSFESQPYQVLGMRLRTMRQKCQQSTAEVSGAVEIEVDRLERIEQGRELPSEDILMLLISYFGLGDDEAVGLWELAGYDQDDILCDNEHHEHTHQRSSNESRTSRQPIVVLALDSRVVYTNGAEIIADKNGLVLSFTQFTDPQQGPVPVARVGMSYQQAEQVLDSLQRTLLRRKYLSDVRPLPMPRTVQPKRTSRSRKKPQQNE